MRVFITGLVCFSLFIVLSNRPSASDKDSDLSVIPRPGSVLTRKGSFNLNERTRIVFSGVNDRISLIARYLADRLSRSTGFDLECVASDGSVSGTDVLGDGSSVGDFGDSNNIEFTLIQSGPDINPEGYRVEVRPERALISAPSPAGLFYGVQTLIQLLPEAIESRQLVRVENWSLPSVTIEDEPVFRWRGVHLDVCRHFFPVTFIKKIIDLAAVYKLNTFHWHLTEDQGWRIEIKAYPKLTEIGAFRKETMGDGQPYGGFYTQEEIRDVVAYAKARFIEVVPEIEMPGHALAALASYPELSCTGGPFEVGTRWGVQDDVYCAGNEKTFEFLESVLIEVISLFPGEYIHIGGDECPKKRWIQCEKCQERIRSEGLLDEEALQSYFIRRIENFLNRNGKRLIGWDEILQGGLAPNATVMSWRGVQGGIQAAREGHDVVMSPTSHCYFDYYQAFYGEPKAIGGFVPLHKVYAFDPVPNGLSEGEASHIIGAQANVWTEYMADSDHVEYMMFPRLCALSEVVWSEKKDRNYGDFTRRMQSHYERLTYMNVHFRPPYRK